MNSYVGNTDEYVAWQRWPNGGSKVAKSGEGRQGAAVSKCVKEFFFEVAKIFNSHMAYSNSIKLLPPKILLAEKMTLKVEFPVF